MSQAISDIEKSVLKVIQHGFPRSLSPYADMAKSAGISTEELLEVLRNWDRTKKLRRLGAIVSHFQIGLGHGAMVVWIVEPEQIEQIGAQLSGFSEVSHAYQRPCSQNWPYNLYTMVHGSDPEEVSKTVKQMSDACGITDYRMLLTEKELKKVSPTYIP